MRRTPPIYTSGKYELRLPWVVQDDTVYICNAVRSFPDLYERNIDVLNEVYIANGLTKTEFDADAAEQATIVTLVSKTGEIIYVPDTYIISYPNMANIVYNRVIVSIDLGTLPDYKDLSALTTMLSSQAAEAIGVVPDVVVHVAQTADYISSSQHDSLETARDAVIAATGVTPNTDKARLKLSELKVNELETKVASYEQIVIDAGIVV